MLAHCAIKAKAESIYTWNLRHYALCDREVSRIAADARAGVATGLELGRLALCRRGKS